MDKGLEKYILQQLRDIEIERIKSERRRSIKLLRAGIMPPYGVNCDNCGEALELCGWGEFNPPPSGIASQYTGRLYCHACLYWVENEYDRLYKQICEACGNIFYSHLPGTWCRMCLRLERVEKLRVERANRKSTKLGLESTLTLPQWLDILNKHNRRCVYCGGEFNQLDHVIPTSRGGGSTSANCVPCCGPCNANKGNAPNYSPAFAPSLQRVG